MPQPQIYDFGPEPFEDLYRNLGQGFAQGTEQRGQEDNLANLLSGISGDANQEDVLKQILSSRGLPMQQKLGLFDALSSVRQQVEQTKAANELAQEMGLPKGTPIEQLFKERELRSKARSGDKLSPEDLYRKKLQIKKEEDLKGKAEEAIPKLQDQLSNLDYLEQLAKEMGYVKGAVGSALGSERAKEFSNLGVAVIEPIVKLFNPVGPIATQKFLNLKSDFAPKSYELPGTKLGKIKALKRIATQALDRHQKYLELLEEYDGKPPKEALNKFSKDSTNLFDKIVNEEKKILKKEEKEPSKVTLKTSDGRTFKVERGSQEHLDLESLGASEI